MKRLAIIPTVFAFVVMVAACTDTTAPDVTPQFDRASTPNCIEVLATFFAPSDPPGPNDVGLKFEFEFIMAVAAGAGVPVGQVISNLTGRTGTVNQCLGFLMRGG